MARVAPKKAPQVLATLSTEDTAAVKAAIAAANAAAEVADRLRMRLEGAKADLLDAEDASRAVIRPILLRHGLDPDRPLRLNDDGTVVPVTPKEPPR